MSKKDIAAALEFVKVFVLNNGDVEPTTQQEYDLARQLREQGYHQSERPDTK